jgi:hypoxanthine phosphoribosyltransferase
VGGAVKELFSAEAIRATVERLAGEIDRDFEGREVVLLGVLTGAFLFTADLARSLKTPCRVDFVRLSSYGDATRSSRAVSQSLSVKLDLAGCHVIVVEEIVDTGLTLQALLDWLSEAGAASVKVCALVDKKARREVEVPVEYAGFAVEDGFLVGYGLDLAEKWRNLPAIYLYEEPD